MILKVARDEVAQGARFDARTLLASDRILDAALNPDSRAENYCCVDARAKITWYGVVFNMRTFRESLVVHSPDVGPVR